MIFSFLSILLSQGEDPLRGRIQGPSEVFNPTDTVTAVSGGEPIEKLLSTTLGFFTIIGGLMFLIYFLFAGLTWISAGGEKGKVDTSKTQMTNAAIGLTIVIVSQAIIGIVSGVLGIDILNPVTVLKGLWT